ncbi:MAG TPA: adenosylcobinamide amidohydrolase [Candidatus Dormibacteraeota bacterium]|jgi:adenosylcobinamide amidohydrolase|nr:adenosylcobinamide amidohydrolase [Candidatus Dormibacteraeota bacterium]
MTAPDETRPTEASGMGVRIHRSPDLLVVEAPTPLAVASTAVLGGGLTRARRIVAVRVSRDYAGTDPAADIRRAARARGWTAEVGLMTAVPLDRTCLAAASAEGVTALAAVTAGVQRLWSAGSGRGPVPGAGTINLIAILDGRLEEAAALNLLTTVTEAKVLTLLEAGLRTGEGDPASGTATDAVVVASPAEGAGRRWRYGGPATAPGWAAAAATRLALRRALAIAPDRGGDRS